MLVILTTGSDTKAITEDARTVYLSATEYDYPPFSVTDEGEADGFSVELLKAVAEEMGIAVTFKIDQWTVLKDELKNGELDILPLVGYTEERDEVYDFTVPYIVMRGNIFVRTDYHEIESQNDLFGKRILVLDGDNSQEWAWSIGLDSELTATSTYLEAFELLAGGTYDAVLAQGLVGEKLIQDNGLDNIAPVYIYEDSGVTRRKLHLEGYEQKFSFAVVEGDKELLSLLNEGLAIVSANGTYDTLYQKWFPFLLENKGVLLSEILRYLGYILTPLLVLLVAAYFYTTRRTIKIRTREILLEKERSERYLKQSVLAGKIFEASIVNAPIPIMIHADDGTVLNISRTWTTLTQYDKEEIQTIYDWAQKAYGKKKQEVQTFIEKLYTLKKTQHDGEFEVTTKDGRTLIWDFYSMNIGNLPDGRAIAMSTATDVTKRNQMMQELKESEQRFKILHNASFGGIAVHDKGLILECNQGLSDITGYSVDELVGMDGLLLIAPDNRAFVMEKITSGFEEVYEVYGIRKNREIYPLKLEARNIPYKGRHVRAVEFRDITELKVLEEERRTNENELLNMKNLLSYIVEHNNNGVAVYDKDLNYVYVSRKYLEQYTIHEDIIGRHYYEVFPDLPQEWRDIHTRALMGKVSSSEKDSYEREDGSIAWTRWECRPWFDSDGTVGGIVVYTEVITERIKLLENLTEKEYNLSIAQEIAHVGSFDYNLANDELMCSDECLRICGITQEEFSGKSNAIIQFIRPEERDYAFGMSRTAITKKKIMQSELHIIRQDGEERIVDFRIGPRFDENGNCIRTTGTIQDITERKNIEKELIYLSYHDHLTGLHNRRFFEEELAKLDTEENLPLSVIMCDVNGLKIVNDSFGHEAGDRLLRKAARIIQEACRKNDIVARVGGDEFVIALPSTSADETIQIVNHLQELASRERVSNIKLSISFGNDTKTADGQSISELVVKAENHMYRQKLYARSSARSKTIDLIMNTLFEKSTREAMHSNRVSQICQVIALKMDFSKNAVNQMRIAGLMHDIGKIGVDEKILNKSGSLNSEERVITERHPEIGWKILSSTTEFSELAQFILYHHERWDGSGYPNGLKGIDIPIESRIIAIADAYDAMTSNRSYKEGISREQAVVELKRCSGTQFDPEIVDVFIRDVLSARDPENLLPSQIPVVL
ncbi:MAG: PAS domain S-box protein [Sphaerochaetaceae bacterium]|nr:PAS domain S-box protein [Sphaerochaetaceae bacterium]